MKAMFLSLLLLMSSSVFALDFGDVCHEMATKEASKTEWVKFHKNFDAQWQTAQADGESGLRSFLGRKLLEKIPSMKSLKKDKPRQITEIFCWVAMFKENEELIPWYLKTIPDDFIEELHEKVQDPKFTWKDLNDFLITKMERHKNEAEQFTKTAD